VIELANTTTLDANNDVLGNWRPTNTIPGPKDSLFVACDTGSDPDNRGANSVYCYHVVTEQNLATGEFYTKNVYPVFANTSGLTAPVHGGENLPVLVPPIRSASTIRNNGISGAGSDWLGMIGYNFESSSELIINALGIWDGPTETEAKGLGLEESSQIGIWRVSDGAQLAVTTVGAGRAGILIDEFRYSKLNSPITLDADIQYVVAAMYTSGGNAFLNGTNSFPPNAGITGFGSPFASGSTFRMPTLSTGNQPSNFHYIGPNITFIGPDYPNHTSNVGMSQSCAGMVLDHEDPPNLYYMSANNMYRIKPKGYSYQIGDTEIEQVFPEDYFRDTLKYHGGDNEGYYSYLGFGRKPGHSGPNPHLYYQNNYQNIQVDSRNRIYFGGMANLFCYSRGSNTSGPDNDGLPLYNQSNTEFSTLQVVANSQMYTANVDFNYGSYVTIDSFVLGDKTSNSAFTGGDPGNPSAGANNFSEGVYITMHDHNYRNVGALKENGRRLIAIYPNANGSFVTDEGGQLAMTIMDEDPAANTKFAVDFTGGLNKFRGIGPGKVVLRPEKI